MRDLIPRLKAARAQGIVEYPLNKIVHVSVGSIARDRRSDRNSVDSDRYGSSTVSRTRARCGAARSRPAARSGVRAAGRARSSRACGATAIAALLVYARRFDGLDGRDRGHAARDATRRRDGRRPDVRRAIAVGGAEHPHGGRDSRCRAAGRSSAGAGRPRSSSASLPLDRVGCYVPGRPLSAALVAADDRDSGARRRRARDHRGLSRSRTRR